MSNLKKYTALVVDDHLESLEGMVSYLSLIFSKVYKAVDGEDALNLFYLHSPDIIFTDVEMPNIDGFTLVSEIRKENKTTPIVMISAYDDKEKLLKAIKLNIIDYLIKPLTSEKLKNAIDLSMKKLDSLDIKIDLGNDLIWDKSNSSLYHQNVFLPLCDSETKLLSMLISNMNHPVDSMDLFNYIWSGLDKEYNSRSIRNLILKLRKKLNSDDLIQNIYGKKYALILDQMNEKDQNSKEGKRNY